MRGRRLALAAICFAACALGAIVTVHAQRGGGDNVKCMLCFPRGLDGAIPRQIHDLMIGLK